ncbi:uncharacterized protein Bfra_000182 [Botrytis fragariae]|uniref:Uncharacterized protein n=1 Tax=Botrytis fragariae TaxID=1964551 RepID=A0A8H6B2A3_9HELO|nr:uncharacterized protein Bfra_000182 [Botrytis fragariae]KAF5878016.1 hypothetical protein Bfra_000182 [Botrytis fragariae]
MPDISRNRIEIWRSEVESQTSSQSGVAVEMGWNAPVVRPQSFWRRVLGLGYSGSGSGSGSRGHEVGNGSRSGSRSRTGSSRSVSIGRKLGLVKGEIERTGMYTVKIKGDKDELERGRDLEGREKSGERGEGSSMELDGCEESVRGGLRERKNRLERAAKLLGKNEGPRENRQRIVMGCEAVFGGLDNIIHDTGELALALDKLMGGATYVLQPQIRSHGAFKYLTNKPIPSTLTKSLAVDCSNSVGNSERAS